MAEPKIRYDVEATASGEAEVGRLAAQLGKLDAAIDPAAAARAQELAAKLRELGQQDQAIQSFVRLKRETGEARQTFEAAQAAAQQLGKEIAAAGVPTRAQAGLFEKLKDAVGASKLELQNQTAALDASRAALTAAGLSTDGLAQQQAGLRRALQEGKQEAAQLGVQYEALQASLAEGAAAMQRLEEAARATDADMALLAATLQKAEAAAKEFAAATDRVASAGADDVAATQKRIQSAQALVAADAQLTAEQRELAAQRSAGRAGLVAEAQALLASARAAEESRAATQRLVAESRSAGDVLKSAFAQTGVRSLQAIEAELTTVEQSVSLLERRFRSGAISADDLARAVAGAAVRMNTLKAEIATIPAAPGQFAKMGELVNGLVGKFGALSAAVATVGIAVKPILDATIALDQLRRVLATVTGSTDKAQEQIEFLRVSAQKSGLAFDATAAAYSKFAASAAQSGLTFKEIQDVFGAVTLAAGNLGLGTEKTERALEALGQIASKGVVSMEELRQQLGDALPGVLPLLAKELGLTQQELQKVVQSGRLLATEALPAIGRSLGSLQPANGTGVQGLTADFNRFINVVKEAGTVLTDGPLGRGAGVIFAALAGVLRDVTVIVTGASEAFKLFGLTVLGVFDALRGDITFDQLKARVSDFAAESGARLEKFQTTAYGAGEAAGALNKQVSSLGSSFAKLALQQQKDIDAAEALTQSSAKLVEARKAEAEASATLATLIGDEAGKRVAAAESAAAVAVAAQKHADAERSLVQVLIAARDATLAKAIADGHGLDAIKATVEALDAQILKAEASAEKSHAQAGASRAQALAFDLATEAAGNNSNRLVELRKNVENAEIALRSKQRALRLDATTSDDVRRASEALAKAKGLLRDAIDDLSEALERNLKLLRADAELAKAGLQLEVEKAKNAERVARDQGNETAARKANLRVRELELSIGNLDIDLKRRQAEAGLIELDTLEKNLRASGQLTAEKQIEIDVRRKSYLAAILEAAAQNEATASKREEVSNLRAGKAAREEYTGATGSSSAATERDTKATRENTGAREENLSGLQRWEKQLEKLRDGPLLGGIGPSQDGKNFGVRSAGGPDNVVNGLTPIDSFGDLIRNTPTGGTTRTTAGQFGAPDNSGDYFFNTARVGEGPFGLGVWELKPEAVARRTKAVSDPRSVVEGFRAQQAALYPQNANLQSAVSSGASGSFYTATGGEGKYLPTGQVQINFNFGSRSYQVTANSRADAEGLARELERQYQLTGGG